ncbi:MAG: hypothetical protein K9J30_05510 [Bacteroidales bacterium]|nr:hypothetical protein [Bacteroidales bacterium]
MKTIILTIVLFSFSFVTHAQALNIHKNDGSVVKVMLSDIDSISFTTELADLDEFYNSTPEGWSCEILQNSFDTLPIPQGPDGRLEDPIAVIIYSKESLGCTNNKSLFLQVYDISKKDKLEQIIADSQIYSWCIPIFFGENENYYVITSPCYLSNGCWTMDNIIPLYLAIKGLFTRSIIEI